MRHQGRARPVRLGRRTGQRVGAGAAHSSLLSTTKQFVEPLFRCSWRLVIPAGLCRINTGLQHLEGEYELEACLRSVSKALSKPSTSVSTSGRARNRSKSAGFQPAASPLQQTPLTGEVLLDVLRPLETMVRSDPPIRQSKPGVCRQRTPRLGGACCRVAR